MKPTMMSLKAAGAKVDRILMMWTAKLQSCTELLKKQVHNLRR